MVYALAYQARIQIEECCNCGAPIALTKGQQDELRRTHRSFYCASGHSQAYQAKSDSERLQEAQAALEVERNRVTAERWEKERAQATATRLRKRIKAGVCPCCKRTFSTLARHMATKHPDYKP